MTSTHPAADVLPLLVGEEFDALVLDIRANGLRDPIILHPDGSLLDGRNRERACARAGIAPRYETWDGEIGTEAAFVISVNIRRRHLERQERARMAAEIANLKQGVRPHTRHNGGSDLTPVVTIEQAAALFDVSKRSVERARTHAKAAEREEMEENELTERRDKRGRRLPDPEVQAAKTAQAREKAKHVNAMVDALSLISQLPDPSDIVSAVTPQQRVLVRRMLPISIQWLALFEEKWNEYHTN